jgi:CNT family concentrative nucleoside transporter
LAILRWIIRGFGIVFQRVMGLGGASALAVAANIFLGTVEAPIIIRGYLDKLSRSELFLLMTVGLATVAGSTMVAYASLLAPTLPDAAGHVLTASIIAAPAGVLLSRIVVRRSWGRAAPTPNTAAPCATTARSTPSAAASSTGCRWC